MFQHSLPRARWRRVHPDRKPTRTDCKRIPVSATRFRVPRSLFKRNVNLDHVLFLPRRCGRRSRCSARDPLRLTPGKSLRYGYAGGGFYNGRKRLKTVVRSESKGRSVGQEDAGATVAVAVQLSRRAPSELSSFRKKSELNFRPKTGRLAVAKNSWRGDVFGLLPEDSRYGSA
jgi:hypothetical protein